LVNSITATHRAPFLSKNLWNSLRIEAIDRALPRAVFLVAQRDPILMAQSMLLGRRRALGDAPGLWSIRPPEAVGLTAAPPIEQIANQLLYTYRAIDRARERLGASRFLDVHYADLCRSPDGVVGAVDEFLGRHGASLTRRGRLTGSFPENTTVVVSDEELARLCAILRRRWPAAGS
jgi:hypothetical protein